MTEPAPVRTPYLALIARQVAALDSDIPLTDWEAGFVGDIARQAPESLTPRQCQTVERLAWLKRAHLPADLVPAAEPRITADPPGTSRRSRQIRAQLKARR